MGALFLTPDELAELTAYKRHGKQIEALRAMGIPYTAAHGTIRFSLSRYNSEEEIDRVIEVVPPIIAQLRKLSPYWQGEAPASASFAPAFA